MVATGSKATTSFQSESSRKYGLLLPHFGQAADRRDITTLATQVEELGFDSVWVRDHIVYRPHGSEDSNRLFVEAFVTMSAVAAVTQKLILGTAALIPFRHPVHTAHLLGSLEWLAGPGRVIAGVGLGTFDHEFEAVGMPSTSRAELVREQVAILRKLWAGDPNHDGPSYRFQDIAISPTPSPPIPIYSCGSSYAAVRRAVEYCDGWLPARMPLREFQLRISKLRELADASGREAPKVAAMPIVVPGRTVEEASKRLDIGALAAEGARFYPTPPEGYRSVRDLTGAVIAGPPAEIAGQVKVLEESGAEHVIFDLRHSDSVRDSAELLAHEVLPWLRMTAS